MVTQQSKRFTSLLYKNLGDFLVSRVKLELVEWLKLPKYLYNQLWNVKTSPLTNC